MVAQSPTSLAAGVLVAAALAFGPAAPAVAAPKPTEAELRAELKKLNKQVDTLIETYNASRVDLTEARGDEKTAKRRLTEAQQELVKAEGQAAQITQMRYQAGDGGLPALLMSTSLSNAVLLEQLRAEQNAVVATVTATRDARKTAADQAAALTVKIRDDSKKVAGQRAEAEDLIKDIEKKLEDLIPYGSGRNSDGSWAPQLPSGSDNITLRTRQMRELLKKTFTLPHEVGCYRVDNSGEHPLGRACDFMLSTGGSTPSAVNQTLGDQIAAWAVKNKDKLGVKYVIWKQRINQGSGWRSMSNRGSITANHYDHVHISMN